MLSCGALLDNMDLVELARGQGGRIIVPTGALLGLDAVVAAAEGEIRNVRMVTRKPPAALSGAPYLETNGIGLSGLLDDGTVGLMEIKRAGGIAIVQDPNDTEWPSMPLSALVSVAVDYCLPAAQIGTLLQDIVTNTEAMKKLSQETGRGESPAEGGSR